MKQLMLVALGGAIGAILRWKVSGQVLHHTAAWKFPLATFLVNVSGCLVAGVLAGVVTKRDMFTTDTRLFLFTGLLGGFTTFSAFGVETVYLLRREDYAVALLYVLFSVVGGLRALAGDVNHSGEAINLNLHRIHLPDEMSKIFCVFSPRRSSIGVTVAMVAISGFKK